MQPSGDAARLPRVVAAACAARRKRSGKGQCSNLRRMVMASTALHIVPGRAELPAEGCMTSSCSWGVSLQHPASPTWAHLKAVLRETLLDQQPQQVRQQPGATLACQGLLCRWAVPHCIRHQAQHLVKHSPICQR